MDYLIELQPGAEDDIEFAFNWYETQRPDLGGQFLDELESYYKRLEDNPFIFSFTDFEYRQAVMVRFPYVIIYKIIDKIILVYAVFHTSRDPGVKFRIRG